MLTPRRASPLLTREGRRPATPRSRYCPTGKIRPIYRFGRFVQPLLKKYSDLQNVQGGSIFLTIPSHQRGDTRSSRSRGGLRWTPRVLQTSAPEADGQVVLFWLPDAGVKFAA